MYIMSTVCTPEHAPRIAVGLTTWFGSERISAMRGGNKTLDNLEKERLGLILPFEHPEAAMKAKPHIDRLRTSFSADFLKDSKDDYLLARYIFGSLMLVSGRYRSRIHIVATDQNDYYHKRFKNPSNESSENSKGSIPLGPNGNPLGGEGDLGLDLEAYVQSRLEHTSSQKPDTPRSIVGKTMQTLDEYEMLLAQKHSLLEDSGFTVDGAAVSPYFGDEKSAVAEIAFSEQMLWTEHLIDQISFAAKSRRGLERVPFLQPVSITEQPANRIDAIFYPFAA